MASIKIPTPLRSLTNDEDTIVANASNLKELIAEMENSHPGIAERLLDENDELRRFVNVFINGEDVRFLDGLDSPVRDDDEVSIVPAVAGG
ncbi:MAG: molybdopterin synthase sulfur carrier subunit [Chloroflexi bacterium]|nr:molybdopterin synthase sulfur carrier subunit [Chloroflexota bacterium]